MNGIEYRLILPTKRVLRDTSHENYRQPHYMRSFSGNNTLTNEGLSSGNSGWKCSTKTNDASPLYDNINGR